MMRLQGLVGSLLLQCAEGKLGIILIDMPGKLSIGRPGKCPEDQGITIFEVDAGLLKFLNGFGVLSLKMIGNNFVGPALALDHHVLLVVNGVCINT